MRKTFKERSRIVQQYILSQQQNYYVKEENESALPFDFIISKLDEESKRIIYCDYVVIQEKQWYLNYYSKSTYYRLKNIALDKFISYITNP